LPPNPLFFLLWAQSASVRFEIVERDGLARTGELELDGAKVITPAIAFVDTKCFPAPENSLKMRSIDRAGPEDLLIAPSGFGSGMEREKKADARIEPGYRGSPYAEVPDATAILTPSRTSELLLDSRKFVDALESLKNGDNLLKPLLCSVLGLPHRLALLAYTGFDLFDSLPLIMASETGSFLTSTGVLPYERLADLPCSCPHCGSGKRSKEHLLKHNYETAQIELKLVRHAISQGTLRELVENRVRTDPWLVQNLRLLDIEHQELLERHAPIKGAAFHAGSKESLSRPEIIRWRKRLEQRYHRPPRARILVLLPCSARKPYSLSKSHLRFRQAIQGSGKADIVHEVIVTSPIGLVPRELELFYPAQDYDIPVTGHWDRDEKTLAEEMVSWLVSTQSYDMVISHLGDEREPVNSVLKDFTDTSMGSPGSSESLDRLEKTLKESGLDTFDRGAPTRFIEDLRSICRFQFGDAGAKLCDEAHLWGRWPHVKIMRGDKQLGMLTGERGMISLTLEGGKVIAPSGDYSVEIDDFVPKGNLFAVGVEGAGKGFRIGDDVVVVHAGDARAVGVAVMTPEEMILADRGEAVHVRHAR